MINRNVFALFPAQSVGVARPALGHGCRLLGRSRVLGALCGAESAVALAGQQTETPKAEREKRLWRRALIPRRPERSRSFRSRCW